MGLRTFTFAGTSSSTYSMFITEAATYNVPERAVEMLEVPGRNGYFALDQGRFENVEVTYHVVVHKDTNANFQTELSSVRNWLASKVGYQRLTDDYNSNVYRMAIFKGGLETDETFVNGAEFDIVFECKPQRWLTSGETAVTIANSGDTITNPTLFDASPLLKLSGYGEFALNGNTMELISSPYGRIVLYTPTRLYVKKSDLAKEIELESTFSIDTQLLNNGDDIILTCGEFQMATFTSQRFSTMTTNTMSAVLHNQASSVRKILTPNNLEITLQKGTGTTITDTCSGATTSGGTWVITRTITFNGSDTVTLKYKWETTSNPDGIAADMTYSEKTIVGMSTLVPTYTDVYIDFDTGEAYQIVSDLYISMNDKITGISALPTLPPGSNTITFDNTITSFKITPRWWKV